jgi:hypothetical protein
MKYRLPPDTRQETDLIGGLGTEGLIILMGGGATAWLIIQAPGLPLVVRIVLCILVFAIAAAFAWVKWPMADYGDHLSVWMVRALQYLTSDHTPKQPYFATRPQRPHKGAR